MNFYEDRLQEPGIHVETEQSTPEAICCASCGHAITWTSRRIEVEGSHQHAYLNPAGMLYRFECYSEAPGCREQGARSREWSWFEGCSWRIACCGGCGWHLGWRFEGPAATAFYGLVCERLRDAHSQ